MRWQLLLASVLMGAYGWIAGGMGEYVVARLAYGSALVFAAVVVLWLLVDVRYLMRDVIRNRITR